MAWKRHEGRSGLLTTQGRGGGAEGSKPECERVLRRRTECKAREGEGTSTTALPVKRSPSGQSPIEWSEE